MAKALAEALEVSLDYQVVSTDSLLDKTVVKKIHSRYQNQMRSRCVK